MIVVVIEPALAYCNGTSSHVSPDGFDVTRFVEICRVVRMDAGGMIDEPRVRLGNDRSAIRSGDRLSDGHDGRRAGIARADDDSVAIDIERGIGEVGMAIDVVHTSKHRRD